MKEANEESIEEQCIIIDKKMNTGSSKKAYSTLKSLTKTKSSVLSDAYENFLTKSAAEINRLHSHSERSQTRSGQRKSVHTKDRKQLDNIRDSTTLAEEKAEFRAGRRVEQSSSAPQLDLRKLTTADDSTLTKNWCKSFNNYGNASSAKLLNGRLQNIRINEDAADDDNIVYYDILTKFYQY
ncbi:hypothetical protein DPMN_088860 [Dreissena polymorpha]|uniref:Uncharacterized protein n=1 Tax=Dreissena polymorpha TaxID=45954 RepID=A0A9D4KVR2_DREPO|nr:hypothetical protein DPMN_088860 [Dreissena polymorpha]